MATPEDSDYEELSKAEMAARIEQLEDHVETLTETLGALTVPGVDTESRLIEDFKVNGLPIGAAITSKATPADVEEIVEREVETSKSDSGVRTEIDRDALLPAHDMWIDIKHERADRLGDSERRAARLFKQFLLRAGGDPDPKVTVLDQYYTMDSGQVKDVLRAADDMTDGGVSKTARRSMEALQRFTKVEDCDCETIETCDHGLIQFDATSGVNQLLAEKARLHAYGQNVQASLAADDDGEQPSEASTPAEADPSAEAADADFDVLEDATPVTNGKSDTVVSNVERKTSDQPIQPTQ